MAGTGAIAAVGRSIVALLNRRFAERFPAPARRPTAVLIGTSDFDKANTAGAEIQFPAVSVYIYKVSVDAESRASCSQATAIDGIARIPLCIHLLVTAWDENVEFELGWLGAAIEVLERDASMTGALLDPAGGWREGESLQVVADDINLSAMSEAFEALTTDFRLSMPYIARVVRIESPQEAGGDRVVTVAAGLGPQPIGAR